VTSLPVIKSVVVEAVVEPVTLTSDAK
jgi:hypothetical protein